MASPGARGRSCGARAVAALSHPTLSVSVRSSTCSEKAGPGREALSAINPIHSPALNSARSGSPAVCAGHSGSFARSRD